jgi:hypothetical protein
MRRTDCFQFADTPSFSDACIVRIPAGLTSSESLLRTIYRLARLPSYFGFNWNALSDCLRDLHWIDRHELVLLHADVPELPQQELQVYLDVLTECVTSWKPGEEHSLTVVFPSNARSQITNAN